MKTLRTRTARLVTEIGSGLASILKNLQVTIQDKALSDANSNVSEDQEFEATEFDDIENLSENSKNEFEYNQVINLSKSKPLEVSEKLASPQREFNIMEEQELPELSQENNSNYKNLLTSNERKNLDTAHFALENSNFKDENGDKMFMSIGSTIPNYNNDYSQHPRAGQDSAEMEDQRLLESLEHHMATIEVDRNHNSVSASTPAFD